MTKVLYFFWVLCVLGLAGLFSTIVWTEPGPINGLQLTYCLFGQLLVIGMTGLGAYFPFWYKRSL